jgi:type IV pilus assembly protein PilC
MQFRYRAADKSGKIKEGDIDAGSVAEVLAFLSKSDLKPISVKPTKQIFTVGRLSIFEKITLVDKIFLTKYLSLMLKVGTDLFKAIDILIEDFEKPIIRRFLLEVRTNLEKGNPFYVSFENHPEVFSPVVTNLIKAAETSGNLEKTLADISINYSKEADLKAKVKGALVYPTLLMVASFGILILLVTFVLPRIATVFQESGAKIPLYSRIVLGTGLFLNKYIWIVLPVFLGGLVASWYFFFKTDAGKTVFQNFLKKVPVARELAKKLALERFSSTLSSLLHAGIPMLESLEITADAVGNEEFRSALLRISRENIARGVSIGDSFRKETVFPRVVTNLIAIGEKAGHLEEILSTLSDFYTSEIDSSLKTLVSFLEPVLLLGIGMIVALIALSVIVPIYQFVGQY